MFAADNPLSTYLSRSQVHPAYRSLAHEKRWCEVYHIVGVILSTNYSQFIGDAAHAALIASILAFFYFESGFFFLKACGHLDDAGAWVGTPSASGNLTCGF